jgi:hypothetical protein
MKVDASDLVLPKPFTPVVTGEWEQIQPGLFRAKDQDGKFVHMLIDMGSVDVGRNTEDLPTETGSMMTLVDMKEALKKFD